MIAPEAVVTFDAHDGFALVRSLGAVCGEANVPRNLLRATFRSIGSFIGLAPLEYLSDAERGRMAALALLIASAEELGANGVVRLEFEARELGDGSTIVCSRGVAVVLEPPPGGLT